jgi:hypothetical protein
MKIKNFIKIFLLILFSIKESFAQEISSTNSKNYETKTTKNNNQIEIRLIPKNPPSPPQNSVIPEISNQEDEDKKLDEIDNSNENMIYQKRNGENDFNDLNDSKKSKDDNLKEWREEQKRLREERIRQRNEIAKQKFLENKKRSIIKESEEQTRINNEKNLKNSNKNSNNLLSTNSAPASNSNVASQPTNSAPASNSNIAPATSPSR